MAADEYYKNHTKGLGISGTLAGNAAEYGNQLLRSGSNIISGALTYGPLGALKGALSNMFTLNDYMFNHDKYMKDIVTLYSTDPVKGSYLNRKGNAAIVISQPPIYHGRPDVNTAGRTAVAPSQGGIPNVGTKDSTGSGNTLVLYDPYHSNDSLGRRRWRKRKRKYGKNKG